ncbi:hypothetical protein [Neomegalonema sp.]|uniref:hypothetical protein n=1 Tax=Neomegalonema sp. TaxID=2039713 RepID=UPI00260F01C0|nr:hypothetical protein [Neomegalonema sp.]MDD2868011.1 hypothetical protein [Neomegalonema sp.]
MNRATATAFALVLAASASGAGAQTVLWGGGASTSGAPASGSAPIYNPSAPAAAPTNPLPPPGFGGGLSGAAPQGFPTTPPPGFTPGATGTVQGFPTTPPVSSSGGFPLPIPTTPPPGASSVGSGVGPGGGFGRWSSEAEPTYSPWRGDEAERARELVQQLERLVRAAERQRAADPDFLRDLRRVIERYDDRDDRRPGRRPVPRPDVTVVQPPVVQPPVVVVAPARVYMNDTFSDGDFTRGTVWTPRQGQWGVDPANGLRSVRPAAPPTVARRQVSPQELLQALLVGPQSLGLGPQEAPPNAALIEYAQPIGNAFTLKTRLTDHGGDGAAHLIVHQGGSNWNGYRLELRGGPEGRAVLTRRGASGYTDLANAPLRRFAANIPHDVEWTRAANGAMSVRVDGELLFSTADSAFRDDWRGFAFFNAGGDFSMRSISIEETR